MKNRIHLVLIPAALLFFIVNNLWAELPADQIARLGADLTPLGGEMAGNADGTIPAWDGGLTQPPSGYTTGQHYIDPFSSDPILFTITSGNMGQYADKLGEGHKALLKAYPDTYRMNVYMTRRSAAAPQRIYDATKQAAATAKLTTDGNGVLDAIIGTPFPIPATGLEVIWNHLLRWRADYAERSIEQAAPTRSGDYTLVHFSDQFNILYTQQDMTPEKMGNIILYFKQEVTAPARLAGGILLVHETLNQNREKRAAWLYNPGQRRVRRAPNVAFDNPGTASDGMRTNDQFDMFNGSPERYDWKLAGKKEIYVPYNSYKLASPSLKYKDILTPLHINQEYPRYEMHRVWVVEASLKPGASHIYKRRTFYVDEDSWQILLVDQYDNRDQLWRISEGFAMNYYNVPNLWTKLEVHTDLQAGRYLAIGMDNESIPYNFNVKFSDSEFTPAALRREGRR
ncbi:MAG: outer membrane lipoprotein-sorting protein [Gammaproteobacteria bacterium RBG_16_51_14]|nr:MAG: outer membrane lipoprotein-sorting protein [Gammaproteobacteria bacterium RBG_16_51_14]